MKVEFDPEKVEKRLQEAVEAALEAAISSYAVSSVLREKVAEQVIGGALARALDGAISQLDVDALTEALAAQLSRTIVASAVCLLEDQAVQTMAKLRGLESYDKDYQGKLAKIRAEFRAVRERGESDG